MQAIYVQRGDSVDYTPTVEVAAGQVVVQGDLVGVTTRVIPAGSLGAIAVYGVFDVAKATGSGTGIAAGSLVYWDEGEGVAKTDSEAGANKLLGKTVADADDDAATVRVRLTQ